MKSSRRVNAGFRLGLAVVLVTACRSVPPAVPPPEPIVAPSGLAISVESFAGGSLSGPLPGRGPGDIESDPRRVFPLHAELWLVDLQAEDLTSTVAPFLPLAEATTLVVSERARSSVRAVPRLFDGARITSGAAARDALGSLRTKPASQALLLSAVDEIAAAGMTFGLRASLAERVLDADNFLREYPPRPAVSKSVDVWVGYDAGQFSWALGMASARPPEDRSAVVTPDEARFRPGSPQPVSERLVPSVPIAAGGSVMVLLPAPFDGARSKRMLVYLELAPAPGDDASSDVLSDMGNRIAAAQARVRDSERELARHLAEDVAKDFVVDTARETVRRMAGLVDAEVDPRQALVFLSGALETPLARELILVLGRAALDRIVLDVIADSKKDTAEAPFDPRWSLERASWRELVRALGASDERPPEIRAALKAVALSAAGQLGAFPSLIENALQASADTDAFQARLVAENRIFLEDSKPGARARAYAWLERRGLEPLDFDPLASRSLRREALEVDAERRKPIATGSQP